uniref:Uncharacterized protein n=1 Tax=Arundo donax TaxID=35708 RepID=A0A0A8Z8G6_ARUDO
MGSSQLYLHCKIKLLQPQQQGTNMA